MKKFLIILCVAAALCVSGAAFAAKKKTASAKKPVQAEKKADAPRYVGIWASPDCGSDSLTMMFTPHYALKSTEASSSFSGVEVTGSGKDYDIISVAGEARPVTRTEDGLLIVGALDGEIDEKNRPATWDALELAGRSEYAHCADVSPVVPVPLARIMQKIESVRDACSEKMTSACNKLLFSLADSNGNKRLSLSEFKKTGALLGTLLPLLAGKPVLTPELESAYMQGIDDGERIANEVIAARDKDGSGDLDAKEMDGFLATTKDSVLKRAVKELGAVFPGFVAKD